MDDFAISGPRKGDGVSVSLQLHMRSLYVLQMGRKCI